MNIKSIMIGSTAMLVVMSAANASDIKIAPETAAVEYVRSCDAHAAGHFSISDMENCQDAGGHAPYENAKGGQDEDFGFDDIHDIQ